MFTNTCRLSEEFSSYSSQSPWLPWYPSSCFYENFGSHSLILFFLLSVCVPLCNVYPSHRYSLPHHISVT